MINFYEVAETNKMIEKENLELESLNLVSLEAVPEDAAALLICSPQTDLANSALWMWKKTGHAKLAVTISALSANTAHRYRTS